MNLTCQCGTGLLAGRWYRWREWMASATDRPDSISTMAMYTPRNTEHFSVVYIPSDSVRTMARYTPRNTQYFIVVYVSSDSSSTKAKYTPRNTQYFIMVYISSDSSSTMVRYTPRNTQYFSVVTNPPTAAVLRQGTMHSS